MFGRLLSHFKKNTNAGALPGEANDRLLGLAIDKPTYPIVLFVGLFFFTYLYPQHYFIYRRMVDLQTHIFTSVGLAAGMFTAFLLVAVPLSRVKIQINTSKDFASAQYLAFKLVLIISNIVALIVALDGVRYLQEGKLPSEMVHLIYGDFYGFSLFSVFPIVFVAPFMASAQQTNRPWKTIVILTCITAVLRGMLTAQRLAILQIIIPVFLGLSVLRIFRPKLRYVLLILGSIVVLFIVQELMRTVLAKMLSGSMTDFTVWQTLAWTIERLFAYYADVVNKFYFVVINHFHSKEPYYLQGIAEISGRLGNKGESFLNFISFVWSEGVGSRELNNPGGLAQFVADFGDAGILLFGLQVAAFTFFYFLYRAGAMIGLAVYPALYVTMTDLIRYNFIYTTGFIVPVIAFILIQVSLACAKKQKWDTTTVVSVTS